MTSLAADTPEPAATVWDSESYSLNHSVQTPELDLLKKTPLLAMASWQT